MYIEKNYLFIFKSLVKIFVYIIIKIITIALFISINNYNLYIVAMNGFNLSVSHYLSISLNLTTPLMFEVSNLSTFSSNI